MEQLIRLDKQAERPGTIASIAIGVIGMLVMGAGMSCVLVWGSNILISAVGIIIGLVGILMLGMAYPIYKKITEKERSKIAEQIIALSNELSF
jgi:type IV secretory pathway VirB3-like protein